MSLIAAFEARSKSLYEAASDRLRLAREMASANGSALSEARCRLAHARLVAAYVVACEPLYRDKPASVRDPYRELLAAAGAGLRGALHRRTAREPAHRGDRGDRRRGATTSAGHRPAAAP